MSSVRLTRESIKRLTNGGIGRVRTHHDTEVVEEPNVVIELPEPKSILKRGGRRGSVALEAEPHTQSEADASGSSSIPAASPSPGAESEVPLCPSPASPEDAITALKYFHYRLPEPSTHICDPGPKRVTFEENVCVIKSDR